MWAWILIYQRGFSFTNSPGRNFRIVAEEILFYWHIYLLFLLVCLLATFLVVLGSCVACADLISSTTCAYKSSTSACVASSWFLPISVSMETIRNWILCTCWLVSYFGHSLAYYVVSPLIFGSRHRWGFHQLRFGFADWCADFHDWSLPYDKRVHRWRHREAWLLCFGNLPFSETGLTDYRGRGTQLPGKLVFVG